MFSRRSLLASTATLAASVAHAGRRRSTPDLPVAVPDDEAFWAEIQQAFDLDRTLSNLNNGGCSPAPRVVHEAHQRYLDHSNLAPAYTMWRQLEPGVETVRTELAAEAGCDPDELAITRNASEALQICQLGIDLQRGDEILTTTHDYPRMKNTWKQRVRREGIVLNEVSFPSPLTDAAPLIAALEAARTDRTRVVHVSHVVFLTGQVIPVAAVCAWAREHGLISIVDGAHAFAHVPADMHAIGCDYYGTSLHKWLLAPIGTGFLYVRRERIASTWALQPAAESQDGDIRKFEEIGTHPAAGHNAVAEALAFHRRIGLPRKHARLLSLRARWTDALREDPRFRFHTPDHPEWSGAIGLVDTEGVAPGDMVSELWKRARIVVTPIQHPEVQGVRISPNVYTHPRELDRLVGLMKQVADEAA